MEFSHFTLEYSQYTYIYVCVGSAHARNGYHRNNAIIFISGSGWVTLIFSQLIHFPVDHFIEWIMFCKRDQDQERHCLEI